LEFARTLVVEAFGDLDPRTAQYHMSVERYAALLAALKPKFIHHPQSKELPRAMLTEMGCDPDKTPFDAPRMRTPTSDGYLTTGIAYAFHPHRDTWYSAPMSQINWCCRSTTSSPITGWPPTRPSGTAPSRTGRGTTTTTSGTRPAGRWPHSRSGWIPANS
jgi:hypothetical protein